MKRRLDVEQLLAWNSKWSRSDLNKLVEHADRLGLVQYEQSADRGSVVGFDVSGRSRMTVHPGYLEFRKGSEPDEGVDKGRLWIELSTFQARSSPKFRPVDNEKICPVHGLLLPSSGLCDECA